MTSPDLNHSLLSSLRCSLVGSNHHPERAAGPDRVHLLRQDGDSDSEHHAVQEVHHRWTQLRYLSACFLADYFWPVWTNWSVVSCWYQRTSSVWGKLGLLMNRWQQLMFTVRLKGLDKFCREKKASLSWNQWSSFSPAANVLVLISTGEPTTAEGVTLDRGRVRNCKPLTVVFYSLSWGGFHQCYIRLLFLLSNAI